jgi:hypothetical protein
MYAREESHDVSLSVGVGYFCWWSRLVCSTVCTVQYVEFSANGTYQRLDFGTKNALLPAGWYISMLRWKFSDIYLPHTTP